MKTLSIHTVSRRRRLARVLAICALSASGLLATSSKGLACKCAAPPSATEALSQATAVFEGQVSQLNPVDTDLEVTLKVVRAWKGVDEETIRIRTRRDSAACGITFEQGKSYLVYAVQATAPASTIALEALRCGRTRPAEEAGEDFDELGLGVVPVAAREPTAEGEPGATSGPTAASDSPTAGPKAPAAGGCASCSTGDAGASFPASPLLLGLATFVLLRRPRR